MDEIMRGIHQQLQTRKYFILRSLLNTHTVESFRAIVKQIHRHFVSRQNSAYEILCFLVIIKEKAVIAAFQSYTNVHLGILNHYSNKQKSIQYKKSEIKELHFIAIYDTFISFQEIKQLSEEPKKKKTKRKTQIKVEKKQRVVIDLDIEDNFVPILQKKSSKMRANDIQQRGKERRLLLNYKQSDSQQYNFQQKDSKPWQKQQLVELEPSQVSETRFNSLTKDSSLNLIEQPKKSIKKSISLDKKSTSNMPFPKQSKLKTKKQLNEAKLQIQKDFMLRWISKK